MRRRDVLTGLAVAMAPGLAGCTGGGTEDDGQRAREARTRTFRSTLEDAGVEVHELTIEDDDTVTLVYEPGELSEDADEAQIESRIGETVDAAARSYFDRVYGGWDVQRLEASVYVGDALVVTWRMDREWIDEFLSGAISRDEMAERVEDSVETHHDD